MIDDLIKLSRKSSPGSRHGAGRLANPYFEGKFDGRSAPQKTCLLLNISMARIE
jgi:hypothetical protein